MPGEQEARRVEQQVGARRAARGRGAGGPPGARPRDRASRPRSRRRAPTRSAPVTLAPAHARLPRQGPRPAARPRAAAAGLDGLLLLAPANVFYACGWQVLGQRAPDRASCARGGRAGAVRARSWSWRTPSRAGRHGAHLRGVPGPRAAGALDGRPDRAPRASPIDALDATPAAPRCRTLVDGSSSRTRRCPMRCVKTPRSWR